MADEHKSPFVSWPRPDPNAPPPSLDIAAFLRARLDERELRLRTDSPAQMAWVTFRHADGSMRYTSVASSNGDVWVCDGHAVEPDSVQVVFDRAQELADVAAKRQIIELHGLEVAKVALTPFDPLTGERRPDEFEVTCEVCGWASDDPTSGCQTLRLLALPHAGHPDYREEWKP